MRIVCGSKLFEKFGYVRLNCLDIPEEHTNTIHRTMDFKLGCFLETMSDSDIRVNINIENFQNLTDSKTLTKTICTCAIGDISKQFEGMS